MELRAWSLADWSLDDYGPSVSERALASGVRVRGGAMATPGRCFRQQREGVGRDADTAGWRARSTRSAAASDPSSSSARP